LFLLVCCFDIHSLGKSPTASRGAMSSLPRFRTIV
jgi:hypothetical protein